MINKLFRIKNSFFRKFNNFIWKRRLKDIGKKSIIDNDVKIFNPQDVKIGEYCTINSGVIIQSCENATVNIGNNVTISYNAILITGGLDLSDYSNKNIHVSKSVTIEDNVWIGADVKILPGVRISANSVIAAGSVVNRNIPENVIVAGIPAKIIKKRD